MEYLEKYFVRHKELETTFFIIKKWKHTLGELWFGDIEYKTKDKTTFKKGMYLIPKKGDSEDGIVFGVIDPNDRFIKEKLPLLKLSPMGIFSDNKVLPDHL